MGAPRNKELFAFQRIAGIAPGAFADVEIPVAAPVLTLTSKHGVEYLAPGSFEIELGVRGSSEDPSGTGQGLVQASLQVSGDRIDLFALPAGVADGINLPRVHLV